MAITFEYLADRPEDVPLVMAWWQTVWGDRMGDLATYTAKFSETLGTQALPLDIIALQDGEPVGSASLKAHELQTIYPAYQFWLGSVFVKPDCRGQGIASMLARQIIAMARQRQLPQLYLQTVNLTGGLYAALGWEPLDRLNYRGEEILVMVRKL